MPGLQMVLRMGTCCLNWSTFPLKVLATRRGPGSDDSDLVSLCSVLHIRSSSSPIFSASSLAKGPGGQGSEGGMKGGGKEGRRERGKEEIKEGRKTGKKLR